MHECGDKDIDLTGLRIKWQALNIFQIYIGSRSGDDKSHTGTFDKFINVGWHRIAQPSLRSLMLGSSRAVSAGRSPSTEPLEKKRHQDPRATLRLIIFSRS